MARLKWLEGERLVRNSLVLMAMTALTSLLGLLFWAVATHRYDTTTVGRTTALIAAANVLAILAQLNLSSVLSRFLPTAGAETRRIVIYSYVVTLAACLVLLGIFLATHLGETYLQGQASFRLLLVVTALFLLLGSLQDAVVISLRRPEIALIENVLMSAARLLLVGIVATPLSATGIALSTVAPMLIAIPVVGVVIFHRLIPAHERASTRPAQLPTQRRALSFISAEYLRSVLSTGTGLSLPLIVTEVLNIRATAFFNLPWLINTSLSLFLINVSTAYVIESGFEGLRAQGLARRAAILGLLIVVGGTVAETAGAPLILKIVGSSYEHGGTSLMRVLGLAMPFSAPIILYSTVTWLDQRVWRLVGFEVMYSVTLLVLSPIMLSQFGLVGVGWAYLIAQAVFGCACILPAIRQMRVLGLDRMALAPGAADPELGLTGG